MNNGIIYYDAYGKTANEDNLTKPLLGGFNKVTRSIYPLNASVNWDPNKFVYVVDTTLSTQNTVFFNTSNSVYNVDWGDGYFDQTNFTAAYTPATHAYNTRGKYTIQTNNIFNPGVNGQSAIISVLSFGSQYPITTQSYTFGGVGAFSNCSNLIEVPQSLPDATSIDLSIMFINCSKLNSSNISRWDTSKVTKTRLTFGGCSSFNQPLDNWQTSGITDMSNMFQNATSFNNGRSSGINNWNTSSLSNTNTMFQNSISFNQPLDNWDTSKVTDMRLMFQGATNFNNGGSTGINNWNTSNVTNMAQMFQNCNFNQPIGNWNTSKVTDMNNMFANSASNFAFNQDIGNWDVSSVNSANGMNGMFYVCRVFNNGGSPSISGWNTSNVRNMNNLFYIATAFNQPVPWNVGKVTNFAGTFNNATSFRGSGLDKWNVTGVATTMANMFQSCTMPNITLSGWYGANGCSHTSMFNGANISGSYLPNWKFISGNDCTSMFQSCNMTDVSGLETWNTSGITSFNRMFTNHFNNPTNINLGNWNTSNVTSMALMFYASYNFNNAGSPSISGWDTSKVGDMQSMFQSATAFNQPINSWNVGNVRTFNNMFVAATSFNQYLGSWNVSSGIVFNDMFSGATAFKGSGLENWNLARMDRATSLNNFAIGCTFPSEQYDLILNSWNTNKSSGVNGVANWRTDQSPHFGSSKYTAAGSGARAALVSYGWTFTDGGLQT